MLNAELTEILFRKLHALQRFLRKTTGDHFDPSPPSHLRNNTGRDDKKIQRLCLWIKRFCITFKISNDVHTAAS